MRHCLFRIIALQTAPAAITMPIVIVAMGFRRAFIDNHFGFALEGDVGLGRCLRWAKLT
ncbi:hypothetical protein IF803_26435 [Bradyrhizobium sp. UFLA06-06]